MNDVMYYFLALDPSLGKRYPFSRRSINSTTDIYCLLTVCTVRWQKIIWADAVMFIDAVFNADSTILTRIRGTYIYSCVKERKKQLLRGNDRRVEKRVEKEMRETKRKENKRNVKSARSFFLSGDFRS